MKILIVEDDYVFAQTLLMMLDELGYADTNVQVADNATDALRTFVAFSPDIVLMDIKIKGEKDGIQVAEQMNTHNKLVPVIFMTSLNDDETFQRAKQTNPIAYLIKPFDEKMLERSIELAIFKHHNTTWDVEMFTDWQKDVLAEDSLFVKVGTRLEKILILQIVHLIAQDKYVEIHIVNQKMSVRMSLNELTNKLPPKIFVRISRSQIVNTRFVKSIDLDTSKVIFVDDSEAVLARRYKDTLLERLNVVQ